INHYSLQTGDEITNQTISLLSLIEKTLEAKDDATKTVHFLFAVQCYKDWQQFGEVLMTLKDMPDVSVNLCIYLSMRDNRETLEEWSKQFLNFQQALQKLLTNHEKNVLTADISPFETQWKQAQQ